ncbi:MAG: GDSL-type esterase/lipase family protein [Acidimicrobiia bacterium]
MKFRLRKVLATALTVACGAGAGLVAIATDPGVASAATPVYYLALGDSLAANAGANPASNSYVNRLFQHEAARIPGLTLNNISCGGATTSSMFDGPYCGNSGNQLAAAVDFLNTHHGQVAFVTIDIGGNDASPCIDASGVHQTCVTNIANQVQSNLSFILTSLKNAYPGLKLFGMNYYTPSLAYWLTGPSGQQVAQASVPAAASFNAELTNIYAAAGFPTADVSTAFDNSNLNLTGVYNGVTVPQNVANLCNWTLVCSNSDVHANNTGHAKIADAFTAKIDASVTGSTLAISTSSLPGAQLGVPYSVSLAATGGTAPYKYKKIGKLPKGLKLSPKLGTISGTPKKLPGTFTFQIQVRDKSKPKQSATRTFSIIVT